MLTKPLPSMKLIKAVGLVLIGSATLGPVTASVQATEPLLTDTFTSFKQAGRRPLRGDWKISGGEAACVQDDTLYAKYKNHGPIIFYDLPYEDVSIQFAIKPAQTKTVVFTANGVDGHIFRAVWAKNGLTVRAFPPASEKKSISVGKAAETLLSDGEWLPIEVQLRGDTAVIRSGPQVLQVEHPSFNRPKENLSIGFSFGSLSVKGVSVTALPAP